MNPLHPLVWTATDYNRSLISWLIVINGIPRLKNNSQTFSVTKGPFFVFPACESSGRRRKIKAQMAKLITTTIFIIVKARKVMQRTINATSSSTKLPEREREGDRILVMLCVRCAGHAIYFRFVTQSTSDFLGVANLASFASRGSK